MKKQTIVYILVVGVLLAALILLTYLPEEGSKETQPSTILSTATTPPTTTAPSAPTEPTTLPTVQTTVPTEPTTVPTEPETVPTEPPIPYIVPNTYPEINTFGSSIQEPVLPIPADNAPSEEWISFFYGLLHTYGSWYNMALTSEYQNPEDVDLYFLFYNGTRTGTTPLTEQEKAFRDKLGHNPNIECRRMPVTEINAILNIYFGTEISEYDMSQYESFYFFDQTNSYYFWNNGVHTADVLGIVEYEISDGGIYYVRYVQEAVAGGEVLAEVTLRRVDSYFQNLSNQIIG